MISRILRFVSGTVALLLVSTIATRAADPAPPMFPPTMNAAEIQLALQKVNVLGPVLYVAAHPEDENTNLMAVWANGSLYDTAYLSVTRGDGGQNLLGPELGERLGLIRTHELLAARRLDHAQQFFTRAVDFGFSKSATETLRIWDRDKILADIVWTIRRWKPDVIVTRFSPDDDKTHGHHTASAILAREAFQAAADPKRFPEQLASVEAWKPTRIVWNTSPFFFQNRNIPFDPAGRLPRFEHRKLDDDRHRFRRADAPDKTRGDQSLKRAGPIGRGQHSSYRTKFAAGYAAAAGPVRREGSDARAPEGSHLYATVLAAEARRGRHVCSRRSEADRSRRESARLPHRSFFA